MELILSKQQQMDRIGNIVAAVPDGTPRYTAMRRLCRCFKAKVIKVFTVVKDRRFKKKYKRRKGGRKSRSTLRSSRLSHASGIRSVCRWVLSPSSPPPRSLTTPFCPF